MYVDHGTGWACSDCTMWVANGETPPELDESQTEAWLAGIVTRLAGVHVGHGGGSDAHESQCPNLDADGDWVGGHDCSCERDEFSWSPCDVCGRLGGSRDAVHFFTYEEVEVS